MSNTISASGLHKQAATDHQAAADHHKKAAESHAKDEIPEAKKHAISAMDCCDTAHRSTTTACHKSAN
jgi:hypothetical protein